MEIDNKNQGYLKDKFYVDLLAKLKSAGARVVDINTIEVSSEILGKARNTIYKGKFEGKTVAVKVKSKITIRSDVKSFIREITIGHSIFHERIPKVICVAVGEKEVYVVIDIIENAKSIVNKCKEVSYSQQIDYMVQLANIIKDLHNMNIIHRDINPTNIMVDDNNIVHLTNFGLSKELKSGEVTATIDSKGSVKYLAPELFIFIEDDDDDDKDKDGDGDTETKRKMEEPPNPNVGFFNDIWSLGCVISESLSQIHPWDNLDWDSFDYKKLDIKKKTVISDIVVAEVLTSNKVPFPIPIDLQAPLKDILKLCFKLDKNERADIHDLAEKLREYNIQLKSNCCCICF